MSIKSRWKVENLHVKTVNGFQYLTLLDQLFSPISDHVIKGLRRTLLIIVYFGFVNIPKAHRFHLIQTIRLIAYIAALPHCALWWTRFVIVALVHSSNFKYSNVVKFKFYNFKFCQMVYIVAYDCSQILRTLTTCSIRIIHVSTFRLQMSIFSRRFVGCFCNRTRHYPLVMPSFPMLTLRFAGAVCGSAKEARAPHGADRRLPGRPAQDTWGAGQGQRALRAHQTEDWLGSATVRWFIYI